MAVDGTAGRVVQRSETKTVHSLRSLVQSCDKKGLNRFRVYSCDERERERKRKREKYSVYVCVSTTGERVMQQGEANEREV